MMIHENFVNYVENSKISECEKIKLLYEINHNLSVGDIIDKYIYNNQY